MTHTDPTLNILLIDDEPDILKSVGTYLTDLGHHLHTASRVSDGVRQLEQTPIDIVITDIRLPDGDGFDVIQATKRWHPETEVIVVTAYGDMQNAVRALREGAFDFFSKPVKLRDLMASLKRTIRFQTLKRKNEAYRERLNHLNQNNQQHFGLSAIIGQSDTIKTVRDQIEQVCQAPNTTVLITGETGTGKELVARAIHQGSARAEGPFIAVDCSAITETLFETAFYGHTRGAFTDARESKQGYFELANGGTLFLDEIGDMSIDMQSGLLRTLEERRIRPVGSAQEVVVDIRVVSATNRNLAEDVSQNAFRRDLYYRLNTFTIHLPPLRKRTQDIPCLAHHFLQRYAREMHKPITNIDAETETALKNHPFPGNVRELRNMIERAVILCKSDTLSLDTLQFGPPLPPAEPTSTQTPHISQWANLDVNELESALIKEALQRTQGNQIRAAELLGLSRDALRRRMQRYDLS